jgi:hypothetical protein
MEPSDYHRALESSIELIDYEFGALAVTLSAQFIVECRHKVRPQFDEMANAFVRKVAERQGDIRFSELKQQAFSSLGASIRFESNEGAPYAAHSVLCDLSTGVIEIFLYPQNEN